jgi:hypothetical protein
LEIRNGLSTFGVSLEVGCSEAHTHTRARAAITRMDDDPWLRTQISLPSLFFTFLSVDAFQEIPIYLSYSVIFGGVSGFVLSYGNREGRGKEGHLVIGNECVNW